jgi:hypothetical protein
MVQYVLVSSSGKPCAGLSTLTTPLYLQHAMPESAFLRDEAEQVSNDSRGKRATRPSLKRDAAIDLRIGLKMLGVEGCKLLVEYIAIKRQRMKDKTI